MSFRFSPEKTFAENITALTGRRLEKALVRLAALSQAESSPRNPASHDPAKAIHGTRKDLKRARAVLRLARYGLDPRVFKRENTCLRVAGQGLSVARDAQVLVAVFDRLDATVHSRGLVSTATQERVRQRLADDADVAGHPGGLVPATREVASILKGVRSRLPVWGLPERGGTRLLARALKTVYRKGRHALSAVDGGGENLAGSTGDPALWHGWRKRVKDLAYQIHLLRPFQPKTLKKFAAVLDRLSRLLGDIHDLDVLREKLATGTAATSAWVDDPMEKTALDRLIAFRREKLERKALKIGHRVYAEKPGAFIRRVRDYWHSWDQEPPAGAAAVHAAPSTDESPADA